MTIMQTQHHTDGCFVAREMKQNERHSTCLGPLNTHFMPPTL